jgi:hypothetical protein
LNPFTDETDPRQLFIRAVMSVLVQIHLKADGVKNAIVAPSKSLEPMRRNFAKTRDALDSVLANLTEEQKRRVEDPETRDHELLRIQLEVLVRSEAQCKQ